MKSHAGLVQMNPLTVDSEEVDSVAVDSVAVDSETVRQWTVRQWAVTVPLFDCLTVHRERLGD